MTPRRPRARAIYVFTGAVLGLAALFSACADNRFGLGDECLRSDDCLSGYCSGGFCVAAPPIGLTTAPDAGSDATTSEGGGAEAGVDATATDSQPDAPGPSDAGDGPPAVDANRTDAHEAGGTDAEGTDADGTDANGTDAELDAPADALVDAVADAEEASAPDAADDGG